MTNRLIMGGVIAAVVVATVFAVLHLAQDRPAVASSDRPVDALAPESCKGCHASHVAEWQRSRHAASYTNALFQLEWGRRKKAWCAGCHAPRAEDPTHIEESDPLAQEGIGCVPCHVRGNNLVSSSRSSKSPHQTIVEADFGSPEFCARCHEFAFPVLHGDGTLSHYTNEPMQETVSQFCPKQTRSWTA